MSVLSNLQLTLPSWGFSRGRFASALFSLLDVSTGIRPDCFFLRMTHPKKHVDKVYLAELCHPMKPDTCEKLLSGVVLDDDPKPVAAKAARMLAPERLELTISQGKYHQVKRMVAACGNRVAKLHRIRVGAYELPENLEPGKWVWLSGPEAVLGGDGR